MQNEHSPDIPVHSFHNGIVRALNEKFLQLLDSLEKDHYSVWLRLDMSSFGVHTLRCTIHCQRWDKPVIERALSDAGWKVNDSFDSFDPERNTTNVTIEAAWDYSKATAVMEGLKLPSEL